MSNSYVGLVNPVSSLDRQMQTPDIADEAITLLKLAEEITSNGGVDNFDNTKAIIESGSNANGAYVKYADGTMVCSFNHTTEMLASSATGSVFRSSRLTWTYPVAFISVPDVAISTYSSSNGFIWAGTATENDTTASSVGAYLFASAVTGTGYLSFMAIGRWK